MVSFKELSTEEKYIVRLKVATRKYDVINNYIKIVINEKVNKDIILEEEDKYDYCSGKISVWESIHKNVQMHIKWEWILKSNLICNRIALLKNVHMHGNGECNNGN